MTTIIPLIFLAMYLGLTYWTFKIAQEVGNELTAELTHLGMLVTSVWFISTMIIASWILF